MKKTKHALLLSAVSMLLCLSMLVGSTFAWFTDTASTGVNKIVAGNLDMVLSYKTANGNYAEVDENTHIFKSPIADDEATGGQYWEPGHVEYAYLKVENKGSLAFKYQLGINIESETGSINVNDAAFKLSDYIKFAVLENYEGELSRDALVAEAEESAKLIKEGYSDSESLAAKIGAKEVILVVYMPTGVGNEANHKTGEAVPTINFGITANATQDTVESDSFNNQYDAEALFPNERFAKDDTELAALLADWDNQAAEGVDTIKLAAATYTPVNFGGKKINLIGAVDEQGNPTTVMHSTSVPTPGDPSGYWGGFEGTVENIKFTAVDGLDNSTGLGILQLSSTNTAETAKATFKNCDFVNVSVFVASSTKFEDCDFTGNESVKRAIYLDDSERGNSHEVVVDGCTFSGEYSLCAINVQQAGASSLIIKNSTISGAPVEVGALKALTFESCTLNCNVIAWFSATTVTIPDGSFGAGYNYTNHGY